MQIPAHVKVIREVESVNSNNVGEKLCKHRYQAYRYPYGEISTEAQGKFELQGNFLDVSFL